MRVLYKNINMRQKNYPCRSNVTVVPASKRRAPESLIEKLQENEDEKQQSAIAAASIHTSSAGAQDSNTAVIIKQ